MNHRLFTPLAIAAALSACASAPAPSTVHTDVYCVEHKQIPVIVDGTTYLVDGGCRAWTVGPTPKERQDFDQRHLQRGAQ